MTKKILLDVKSDVPLYTLIGISCHLQDYRLSYLLNQSLDFSFIKQNDFSVMFPGKKESDSFSFYFYYDEDRFNTYCLIANRSETGILVPGQKQTDYFLFIEGEFRKTQLDILCGQIRKIPNILAVFEIRTQEIKNYTVIQNELEMHLMEISKNEKSRNSFK
ncbi:MAG: IPExxxVDY family protein [Bacteroidota bacterium]|nr:IPExxxVDY family protein [Bacteroidota bacterium]